ncbi:MAG TPA: M28 family peptidase [Isosphaeraceae bacterium]
MNRFRRVAAPALAILFVGLAARCPRAADTPAAVAERELLEELRSAPRENEARERQLRSLYEQAGARPEDIRLQAVPLGDDPGPVLHNVIVTKPGATDAVIVVGGHLDKVPPGDGVIDDWSGACLATNLFQALRPLRTRHTFVFIGFAHEERGLRGSRAYVASLSPEERAHIAAMINLECLGVDDPFLWTNGSTDRLEALAHRVADEDKLPLRDHVIEGVGADSIPFDRAGIPTLTFDGLPAERFDLIHSERDTYANILPECYINAYRLVVRFLLALDREVADRE